MFAVTYFSGLGLTSLVAFDGDTPMAELHDRLERFETLTAECELIAKLATDSTKREFYLRLLGAVSSAGGGYAEGDRDQGRGLTPPAIRS